MACRTYKNGKIGKNICNGWPDVHIKTRKQAKIYVKDGRMYIQKQGNREKYMYRTAKCTYKTKKTGENICNGWPDVHIKTRKREKYM